MMELMIIRLMVIFTATMHQGGLQALLRVWGRWQATNYSQGTNSTRAAHQVIIIHLRMIRLVKILMIISSDEAICAFYCHGSKRSLSIYCDEDEM